MMGIALSALLSFLVTMLNMLSVSGAGAKAMTVNFHERNTEKLTEEMRCPDGFPRKSMDGCCRWTKPPEACNSAENRVMTFLREHRKDPERHGNASMTKVECMEDLCKQGKGKWSLYRTDPSGPGVMNVCCNKRLESLQGRIQADSGFSAPMKVAVTKGSLDAFDPAADDHMNSRDAPRNIALLLLFLTLGVFAVTTKIVEIPLPGMFQKKSEGPQTQEFGLPSRSRSNAPEVPKRPNPVKTPETPMEIPAAEKGIMLKEQLIKEAFEEETNEEKFVPLCDL